MSARALVVGAGPNGLAAAIALPADDGGVSPCIAEPYSQAREPEASNSSSPSPWAGISSSRASSTALRGPCRATSWTGPRTGGKPLSIVSRSARKWRIHGSAKATQRSPSPARNASSDAAVRAGSRYRPAPPPPGSGWA